MAQPTEPKKDSKQVVVELTMSVEEARQVIWQGRGTREPMGKLLDSKQLDWSDLAWAAEVGYDPRFREAARTLLASCIGRPTSLRFGPEVVEGSHYLEERERDSLIEFSVYSGLAIGGALWLTVALIQTFLTHIMPQFASGNLAGAVFVAVISLLGIGCIGWVFYHRMRRQLDQFRTFRAGREGEEKIVERLRIAIDNHWTIFRNLHLPGHKDDLDVVLVGPSGVWAVEVKSTKSTLRVEGKKWEIQTKRGWVTTDINPSDEVTRRAIQLNTYLQKQGMSRFVERAVALSVPQPVKNFENSDIPIWLPATMESQTSNLTTRFPPGEDEIKRIVELLKGLAHKQIAIEEAKYQ